MAKKKLLKDTPRRAGAEPSVHEMVTLRCQREGRSADLHAAYKLHREFGMRHAQAMWQACRDMGYTTAAEEKKKWREAEAMVDKNYGKKVRKEETKEQQFENAMRDLMARSEGVKFDAANGIEWVASHYHQEFISPKDCPHIIAWNVLQTSKKYEVAFFKDFLMKALQRGMTVENTEEYAEDDMELSELRAAVAEVIAPEEKDWWEED
jgi:hypothetical protein